MGARHPSFQFDGFASERDLSRGSVVTEEERASTGSEATLCRIVLGVTAQAWEMADGSRCK
jgi:hypothetical protein